MKRSVTREGRRDTAAGSPPASRSIGIMTAAACAPTQLSKAGVHLVVEQSSHFLLRPHMHFDQHLSREHCAIVPKQPAQSGE